MAESKSKQILVSFKPFSEMGDRVLGNSGQDAWRKRCGLAFFYVRYSVQKGAGTQDFWVGQTQSMRKRRMRLGNSLPSLPLRACGVVA